MPPQFDADRFRCCGAHYAMKMTTSSAKSVSDTLGEVKQTAAPLWAAHRHYSLASRRALCDNKFPEDEEPYWQRHPKHVSPLLRGARAPRRAQQLARPHERSHAAFHQRRDEPVQGR